MTPEQALMIALFAAFLTHNFTSKRFKNELKIKKEEKIINDAKELVSEFEKKLLSRIHLTRDYLYALKQAKNDNIDIDQKFRENYREIIKDWNLNFDYLTTVIFRNRVIRSRENLDNIQKSLREFHVFLAQWADEPQTVEYQLISEKLTSLDIFQNKCYTIMFDINRKIDDRWGEIFLDKKLARSIINECFDYIYKTLIIYLAVNMILFFFSFLFQ